MPCIYNAIQYNDFVFQGFSKSSLNTEMVKDDGGNVVKYLRNTLEVEFIISVETCVAKASKDDKIIDADMDYIRHALSCPNKTLVFSYHGAGRGMVTNQHHSEFETNLKVEPVTSGGVQRTEVIGSLGIGPYPEVLQWEPLANNKAAKCRWRCVFYTSKDHVVGLNELAVSRDLLTGIRLPANPHNLGISWKWKVAILSITEEQEVDIDSEGFLVLTLKGVIEFSNEPVQTVAQNWDVLETSPVGDCDIEQFFLEPKNRRSIAQDLARYFEPYQPLGFTRKQRYIYDKTQRKLEYVIVDTEQQNPMAKFPRIVQWEASHKVGSTISGSDTWTDPSGFLSWESLFSGTFTVAPGYWKGWAWVAMLVLIKQRIERTIPIIGDPVQLVKDDIDAHKAVAAQQANAVNRKQITPKHIMTDVSITDYLHNNTVDITIRYIIITSLSNLFKNSGLFSKVRSLFNGLGDGVTPTGNPESWTAQTRSEILLKNKQFDRMSANAVGYNGLGMSNYNIIFDPDNLNLTSESNDNGTLLAWTPPQTRTNIQLPDIYAAHRRKNHYVEHNLPVPDEVVPTNPQKVQNSPGTPPKTGSYEYPGKETEMASWMKDLDPAKSWVEYKPKFELIEVSNSTYLPTIQTNDLDDIKGQYTASSSTQYMTREVAGMTINNRGTATGAGAGQPNATRYANHLVISHGKPVYYIKFTGRAVRVGYPIPMPVVGGLQNEKDISTILSVYRVGKQHWSQEQVATSADMPVFEAEWSMLYAIQGDPSCSNISFNHSRPSEFV